MDWRSVGQAVAKVAPILGSVLGGPAGMLAGAAGALVGAALGVEPDPEAVARALGDPAMLERLRQLEAEEHERLLRWQEAQLQADLANVRDARAREVALAQAGHGGAWVTGLVALVVVCGFFVMLHQVLSSPQTSEPALLLLGSLGSAFGAVVNYYLGSSLGSWRKDSLSGKTQEPAHATRPR